MITSDIITITSNLQKRHDFSGNLNKSISTHVLT